MSETNVLAAIGDVCSPVVTGHTPIASCRPSTTIDHCACEVSMSCEECALHCGGDPEEQCEPDTCEEKEADYRELMECECSAPENRFSIQCIQEEHTVAVRQTSYKIRWFQPTTGTHQGLAYEHMVEYFDATGVPLPRGRYKRTLINTFRNHGRGIRLAPWIRTTLTGTESLLGNKIVEGPHRLEERYPRWHLYSDLWDLGEPNARIQSRLGALRTIPNDVCSEWYAYDGYALPTQILKFGHISCIARPPEFTPMQFMLNQGCTERIATFISTPRWGHNSNNDANAEVRWFRLAIRAPAIQVEDRTRCNKWDPEETRSFVGKNANHSTMTSELACGNTPENNPLSRKNIARMNAETTGAVLPNEAVESPPPQLPVYPKDGFANCWMNQFGFTNVCPTLIPAPGTKQIRGM